MRANKKQITQLIFYLGCVLLQSCSQPVADTTSVDPVNWQQRTVTKPLAESLAKGSSYLSVYSQIYSQSEHRTHDLTATISMRNTNIGDTIYLDKAAYYNTKGELIRTYFAKPIYIAPLETVEIVIAEVDNEGGTGANFMFDWRLKPTSHEPFFEAVMISTSGQQGLSFTTEGRRVK